MATRRRLNKRMVIILTVSGMVLTAVIMAVLMHATVQKDPTVYGDLGDKRMKEGKYRLAAGSYHQAYRCSNDPAWLIKVANACYQEGEVGSALDWLQRAWGQERGLIEARKRWLEIFYAVVGRVGKAGPMKDLEEHASELIDLLPPEKIETDPETRAVAALAHHCCGLGLYARRGEDATLVQKAISEIEQALALDPQGDYVQSLALIKSDSAAQFGQLAISDGVTPEEHDEYIKQMRDKLAEIEKLYLDAAKRTSSSESFLLLGGFYYNFCGGLDKMLVRACQWEVQKRTIGIRMTEAEIEAIGRDKNLSAEQRYVARTPRLKQLAQNRREIPVWQGKADEYSTEKDKRLQQALDAFQKAEQEAKEQDEKSAALVALAIYWADEEKCEQAETLAKEALELDPRGYVPYTVLAKLYRLQAKDLPDEEAAEKTDQAIDVIVKRLDEIPHELSGLHGFRNKIQRANMVLYLSTLYLQRGRDEDLAKVRGYLDELVQQFGRLPEVVRLEAQLAKLNRKPVEAIAIYEEADKLFSERDVNVKLALADLYFQQRDFGAAQLEVDKALQLAPMEPMALRSAVLIYLRLGKPKEVLGFADRLLNVPGQEKNVAALIWKLNALSRLGQLSEADRVADAIKKLGVKLNWEVQKARLLYLRNEDAAAETLLKNALSADPGQKAASVVLAAVYASQNKMTQARSVLDDALSKAPDDEVLKTLSTLMGIEDPKERRQRMEEITKNLTEQTMATALTNAEQEKDPFRRAIKLFAQYMRRDDLENARTYLDEAMKLKPDQACRITFEFALNTEEWSLAEKCYVMAKAKNLDGVNGLLYQGRLANAKAWEQVDKGNADQARKLFEESAGALESVIAQLSRLSLARALLGEAYLFLNRQDEAATHIAKALELGPANPYAHRADAARQWQIILGQRGLVPDQVILSFTRNVRIASRQLKRDRWLKGKADWIGQQIERSKGDKADRTADPKDVVARREQRRKQEPDDLHNLLRLAWVYEYRSPVKDLDKAEACYQQMMEQQVTRNVLEYYRAFATRHKRHESLEAFLKTLAEKHAESGKADGYSCLAFYHLSIKEVEEAEKDLLKAVKIEDNAETSLETAMFYGRINRTNKAIEWAKKAIQAKGETSRKRVAHVFLINALLGAGDWDQAGDQLDRFTERYPGLQSDLMKTQFLMNRGQVAEAETILTQILAASPENVDALGYRSRSYICMWQLEKARADLERLSNVDPDFGYRQRIDLVKLYCELGQTSDAIDKARALIKDVVKQRDWFEPVRLELAASLSSGIPSKDYETLLIWASNLYQGTYDGWFRQLSQFYLQEGRFAEAANAAKQAWGAVQKQRVATRQSVLEEYLATLFQARRWREIISTAEQELGSGTKPAPRVAAWQAAALYEDGQADKGLDTYFKALAVGKDRPLTIWQVTGQCALKGIPAKRLVTALEDMLSQQKDLAVAIRQALACAYFRAGQSEKGTTIYEELLKTFDRTADKAAICYIAGRELSDQGNHSKAAEFLAEGNKYAPNTIYILNNLAYTYAEDLGRAKDALPLIERARQKAPNNADLLDTYGRTLEELNDLDRALAYLARSVWLKGSAATRYHLAMVLLAKGRDAEARIQLQKALTIVGDDKQLADEIRSVIRRAK